LTIQIVFDMLLLNTPSHFGTHFPCLSPFFGWLPRPSWPVLLCRFHAFREVLWMPSSRIFADIRTVTALVLTLPNLVNFVVWMPAETASVVKHGHPLLCCRCSLWQMCVSYQLLQKPWFTISQPEIVIKTCWRHKQSVPNIGSDGVLASHVTAAVPAF